ncbi:hypothetical protein [Deinococcus xinjiangensis]|uniref:hypothetical protein n=1 Tax=Deinococcus xinjiangensis TaxID=457454 RepID=UPI003365B290
MILYETQEAQHAARMLTRWAKRVSTLAGAVSAVLLVVKLLVEIIKLIFSN